MKISSTFGCKYDNDPTVTFLVSPRVCFRGIIITILMIKLTNSLQWIS
jgi:hypothetical protein